MIREREELRSGVDELGNSNSSENINVTATKYDFKEEFSPLLLSFALS